MAGQAGLELVEANELLNERIVVLEEEADSAQTMMQFQRDEIKQLTHELGRTRAGRDRSNVLLKEADEERDRLQHILAENETSHHLALNVAHKHLEDARKMEVNVHSNVESSDSEEDEEEEEEGKSNINNSNNSNKKNKKKYNHPNNHHHHLNKAATDASDHVSRTLQLSHDSRSRTLRIVEKVESLDSSLRSKRVMPKTTTVRQCALWTTWLFKIFLSLLVLFVVALVVDSKDIITNTRFFMPSKIIVSKGVSDYAEETYVTKTAAAGCTVGCGGGGMSTTPVASLGEFTRGVKELQEATLEAVAVDKERIESLRKLLQQPINMTTSFMVEEAIRENVVLNATYVTKTAALNCTVGCGGGVMSTASVASSGESTRGVEELQEATFEAVAVDVSNEKERKVSLGKVFQQPINMTTTLMIEEAPRETIVLNASDLDKNTSACTETMDLCLLHMKMFEPDVAVNTSKSNSSYTYGGKAGGDCILDTCTTHGRESSISCFTNVGNITLLAHRRDSSIGCLKKLGNITLLARRRDLKTRLATLKDRIRNVKCEPNPQMKQTNGLLLKNLSGMNIRRRNTTY